MENLNVKKIFLYTLIGSIVVSALLGIWAILANEFGEFQGRVLSTTLIVVATSILGLACGAFWESPKSAISGLKIVPLAGIILAIITALMTLSMVWQISGSQDSLVLKIIGVSGVFAFSLAQLSLLSMANLSEKFLGVLTIAYLVVLILAIMIAILIITEPQNENGLLMRVIGVLGIIDAALTVMIPVFHRLSYGDFVKNKTELEKIESEIEKLKSELHNLEQQRDRILKKDE